MLEEYTKRAQNAYNGVSFSPEKRGTQIIKDYSKALESDLKAIEDEETKEEYKSKFIQLFLNILNAKSRTISPMITGPARFPVERNRKALESEYNHYLKLDDFRNNFFKRQKRKEQIKEKEGETPSITIKTQGSEVIINFALNRIQIKHEEKPEAETITRLKKNGFKYAPSAKVWQRQNTENGRRAVNAFFNTVIFE